MAQFGGFAAGEDFACAAGFPLQRPVKFVDGVVARVGLFVALYALDHDIGWSASLTDGVLA